MTTWNDTISALDITMTVERADRNPNMADSDNMDHWKCRFRTSDGRRMTVTFSMGSGHNGKRPTAVEVLDCLASDAAGIENTGDFDDWCADYGYDTDSRKAERIYRACQREAGKLRQFLGHLYQPALFETERL